MNGSDIQSRIDGTWVSLLQYNAVIGLQVGFE